MLLQKFRTPVTVHSWNTSLPSIREGFLSEIAYLKVVYSKGDDGQEDLQLVLKILPRDPKIKEFVTKRNLAKRGIEFYRLASSKELQEICTESGLVLPLPEIFLVVYKDHAITLASCDLNVDKCKSLIIKDGSTLNQTKVALEAVSQIHAAGLMFINKHGINHKILETMSSDFSTNFVCPYMIS